MKNEMINMRYKVNSFKQKVKCVGSFSRCKFPNLGKLNIHKDAFKAQVLKIHTFVLNKCKLNRRLNINW